MARKAFPKYKILTSDNFPCCQFTKSTNLTLQRRQKLSLAQMVIFLLCGLSSPAHPMVKYLCLNPSATDLSIMKDSPEKYLKSFPSQSQQFFSICDFLLNQKQIVKSGVKIKVGKDIKGSQDGWEELFQSPWRNIRIQVGVRCVCLLSIFPLARARCRLKYCFLGQQWTMTQNFCFVLFSPLFFFQALKIQNVLDTKNWINLWRVVFFN